MIAESKLQLGIGIYTPAEAAFYARIRTKTLNRWLYGDSAGDPVVDPQLGRDSDRVVTFLDFVQALAIRAIRTQYNVPLTRIRKAVDKAKREFGIQYPFATQHTTYLMTDGRGPGAGELVIRVKGRDDHDKLIQLTGRSSGNYLMKEIAEPFLDDLHFDSETGLAMDYSPFRSSKYTIKLDPQIRFGEPIVSPSGYTAQSLYDAIISEGGIDAAAKAYDLEKEAIHLAYDYIDHLKTVSV